MKNIIPQYEECTFNKKIKNVESFLYFLPDIIGLLMITQSVKNKEAEWTTILT